VSELAIVAGGSGLLGRRVVDRLVRDGDTVLVLDRTRPAGQHDRIRFRLTELTDDEDVVAAAQELDDAGQAPTALINCQGWSPKTEAGVPVPDADVTSADFLSVLQVNLVSCYLTMRSFVPLMARRGSGRVVNVSSTSGHTGRTTASPAYAAAKAGVEALTRSVAVRYGPVGVLACAIAPGKFVNPAWSDSADAVSTYQAEIPLGRLATPDEVAEVIVFLAGAGNRYLTGQTVVVDGGRLA
jgi:NAD(P)-dependent dehydrogenase (short-subunit alcohol dehydrogenase family)